MEKVLDALIKNTPLALIVIGLWLMLIGAAGGFERLSLRIEEPGWRFALGAMGAVVAGFGALLILRGKGQVESSALAKECQLKITSPLNGSDVGERSKLPARFRSDLPREAFGFSSSLSGAASVTS